MPRAALLILSWLLPLGALGAQFDSTYQAPRGPGGVHPDLNGIWQALNEANYDLELHMARSAMQEREGPHGPVPAKNVLGSPRCCISR